MNHYPQLGRRTAVSLGALACLLLGTAPAGAQVSITPDAALPGSSGVFTFVVASDRAHTLPDSTAPATTRVEVHFPVEHPISAITVQPMSGWNVTIARRIPELAPPGAQRAPRSTAAPVSSIVWQGVIPAGHTERFTVSFGPLPTEGGLTFTALQTYSDGVVVRWSDPPGAQRPAPVLRVLPVTTTADGSDETAARLLLGTVALASLVALAAGLLSLRPAGRHALASGRHDRRPRPVRTALRLRVGRR